MTLFSISDPKRPAIERRANFIGSGLRRYTAKESRVLEDFYIAQATILNESKIKFTGWAKLSEGGSKRGAPKTETVQRRKELVLRLLAEPMGYRDLAGIVGGSEGRVRWYVRQLEDAGKVKRVRQARGLTCALFQAADAIKDAA